MPDPLPVKPAVEPAPSAPQPAGPSSSEAPAPAAQAELDVFETDPFFTKESRADAATPAGEADAERTTAPASEPRPMEEQPPRPTAEERLLESISAGPATAQEPATPVTPAVAPPPPKPRDSGQSPVRRTTPTPDPAAPEMQRLRARIARLESDLAAAQAQVTKESQLRKADAARHAMLENESKRKTGDLKALAIGHEEALLKGSPARSAIPVAPGTVVIALLALAAAVLVGRLWGQHDSPSPDSTPSPAAPPAAEEPVAPPAAPMAAAESVKPPPPSWPVLKGERFTAIQTDGALTVKFDYGVFTRGTVLSETARQDLKRIAEALKPSLGAFRLEVEGHTDSTPVTSSQSHGGNHELGLARARAAVDYLVRSCGLPAPALSSTSAGDARPPYPNTTQDGQRRNRTVILKITRATDG